jgi:hypothetical protein
LPSAGIVPANLTDALLEGIEKQMDSKQQHHVLRIQLLSLSKSSLHALDFAIKGFQLGNLDFCENARADRHEAKKYCHEIKKLCFRQITNGATSSSHFRFALASLRLASALHAVHRAAVRVSQSTMQLLEDNRISECSALDRMGDMVTSSVRLCIVALLNSEIKHAETVLRSQEVWRQSELISDDGYGDGHPWLVSNDALVVAIAQSLGDIAKQAHEMADAISFWLTESNSILPLRAESDHPLKFMRRAGDSFGDCPVAGKIRFALSD